MSYFELFYERDFSLGEPFWSSMISRPKIFFLNISERVIAREKFLDFWYNEKYTIMKNQI